MEPEPTDATDGTARTDHEQASPAAERKGYVLAQLDIADGERYGADGERYDADYAPTAIERIQAYGGSIAVGTADCTVLEGAWGGNWTVVIEFPSADAAQAWYDDEAYPAVVPARHDATAFGNLVLLEAFSPADLGTA